MLIFPETGWVTVAQLYKCVLLLVLKVVYFQFFARFDCEQGTCALLPHMNVLFQSVHYYVARYNLNDLSPAKASLSLLKLDAKVEVTASLPRLLLIYFNLYKPTKAHGCPVKDFRPL
jgi:hypothetical protein